MILCRTRMLLACAMLAGAVPLHAATSGQCPTGSRLPITLSLPRGSGAVLTKAYLSGGVAPGLLIADATSGKVLQGLAAAAAGEHLITTAL